MASCCAVAIQAAMNKMSWAKMLKNSMSTITGPKIAAAGLPWNALIRKLARYCSATSAIEPNSAPGVPRTKAHGSQAAPCRDT